MSKPTGTASSGVALDRALVDLLPSPPARVLLLGLHMHTSTGALIERGYEIVAAPFPNPPVFAQCPSETRQAVFQVEVPVPQSARAEFDAAVVREISPHIHPLALFDQLCTHVAKDGIVVLQGREHQDPIPRVTRWLEYVVAIAGRCGFTPLDPKQAIEQVSGAPGTFLCVLRKTATPRWQLRHLRPDDYAEIAVLFQQVFGHALSPQLWAWKYANGRGNAVLASRDGVLVAHYGGMYREILLCGKPEWAYGGSDVMVHPQERGVMTRQGPFLLTAATTAELYGPVAFGFPTERAMLVAERMGLYVKAGQMAELRWDPARPGSRWGTRIRHLTPGCATDEKVVHRLWAAMANDLQDSVVGVRDWKFLEHRYFEHPHNQYEAMVVTSRWTGKELGVIVLRRLENACELLDVIAPLANLPVLLDQARRMTARWALPYLYCWITTNHAGRFQACGGKQELLNVFIPTSCWTDDPRVDMLRDKWWLMSGDTDFR
nr:GNAT family N-acetyltransferase [uncultured Rhodoferax sp.]